MMNTSVCFFVIICSVLFAVVSSMAVKPFVIGTRGSPLALAQAYETKVFITKLMIMWLNILLSSINHDCQPFVWAVHGCYSYLDLSCRDC